MAGRAGLITLLVRAVASDYVVPLSNGLSVGLSTRGPSAFLIRMMSTDPKLGRGAIDTPMVAPDGANADFIEMKTDKGIGVKASFGSLYVTREGGIQLLDANDRVLTTSQPLQSHGNVVFSTSKAAIYGRGASPDDANRLTPAFAVQPQVANRGTYAPYYYSNDGYSALGVVNGTEQHKFMAAYSQSSESTLSWSFSNGDWDMYLMPAATLHAGTLAYYALTGAPRIPPRYAFGFIASRWGWTNQSYIEQTLTDFRSKQFPVDAIIFDFEWFTNESDYGFKPEGVPWYDDFGFNPATFPHPADQMQHYRNAYNIRVGGIRKPRLGNTALLEDFRSKGWILPNGEPGGSWPPSSETYADHRNLDYSKAPVRAYYATHSEPMLDAGMSFFWNDEGETNFYTFHYWNEAQLAAHRVKSASQRFYSINRAFTPGMARLGATVWTGDVNPTWSDLHQTPGMMLNWVLAGAPYVACDTGGFSGPTTPELLTRWMQVSTYMPTMRVHSTISATPHWPWLFGDAAAAAIQETLNMRYRLMPYHYSLAHSLYQGQKLWIRPLVLDFPEDASVSELTTQWMDGDILVAPVLSEDSQYNTYLPEGLWYRMNDKPEVIQGPKRLQGTAKFTEVPTFAKAGTVLPLGPVVQHSGALPGGPLEVQVFAGADGSFDLVEDDGESVSYEHGTVKVTTLSWKDSDRTLSWAASGSLDAPGSSAFTELFVTYFGKDGSVRKTSSVPLTVQGKISIGSTVSFVSIVV